MIGRDGISEGRQGTTVTRTRSRAEALLLINVLVLINLRCARTAGLCDGAKVNRGGHRGGDGDGASRRVMSGELGVATASAEGSLVGGRGGKGLRGVTVVQGGVGGGGGNVSGSGVSTKPSSKGGSSGDGSSSCGGGRGSARSQHVEVGCEGACRLATASGYGGFGGGGDGASSYSLSRPQRPTLAFDPPSFLAGGGGGGGLSGGGGGLFSGGGGGSYVDRRAGRGEMEALDISSAGRAEGSAGGLGHGAVEVTFLAEGNALRRS